MKGIINFVLVFSLLFPYNAWSACDWSKIKKNSDDTYTYSQELNLCVGQLVKDSANQTAAIQDLTKGISMKDLALQAADKRADLWNQTASGLENRLQSVDNLEKRNEWLFFGLGVLTTGIAGFTAAKLVGK